ncbi:MAG: hypothetical protein ACYTHK_09220 [Planctomycetota bacterium]
MANTARKKTTRKKKAAVRKPKLTATKKAAQFNVRDGQLVVRLSRDKHPEVFDADRLMKQMRKVIDTHGKTRKCRDLVEFLEETEKSLEILLRNHLEDAMRKYLK